MRVTITAPIHLCRRPEIGRAAQRHGIARPALLEHPGPSNRRVDVRRPGCWHSTARSSASTSSRATPTTAPEISTSHGAPAGSRRRPELPRCGLRCPAREPATGPTSSCHGWTPRPRRHDRSRAIVRQPTAARRHTTRRAPRKRRAVKHDTCDIADAVCCRGQGKFAKRIVTPMPSVADYGT